MSYLQHVANHFAATVGKNVSSYTFVFPNRRAGLFFRKYLGQALGAVVLSPKVITIDECFHSLSDWKVADQLTLLSQLYTIYCTMRPKEDHPEDFLFWGKMMLSDFSEIDNHLIANVKELFTAVSDLKDLDYKFDYLNDNQRQALSSFWTDFISSAEKHPFLEKDHHERFIHTWDILYPLYDALRQHLRQAGLAYEGMLHREVIETWNELDKSRLETHYVFIGFNALTRSEEQLLLNLKQEGRAEFFFDYDNRCLRDPENRASLFMRRNLELFGTPSQLCGDPSSDNHPCPFRGKGSGVRGFSATLNLIQTPSSVGQAQQVYRILSTLAEQPSFNMERTAVVLPDENMLLPLLYALPESIDKVNVTMGYPVRCTQEFLPIAFPERYGITKETPSAEVIAILHRTWEEMDPEHTSHAVRQLQNTLTRVEQEGQQFPVLPLLRMLTMDMTIPYVGEPLNGLQVMGILETRALDFDTLILTDFNDDIYPGATRGNSYIPYTLRKGFGLPTPERQDAILAYNFYRMLAYAKQVYLITSTQADDRHSGEPSRYLYQLRYQYPDIPITTHVVVNRRAAGGESHSGVSESANRGSASLAPTGGKGSGLGASFSPSALNRYLRCPRSYYYRYVVGLPDQPPVTDEVTELEMGTAFHATMQALYAPYLGQVMTRDSIAAIREAKSHRWGELPSLEPVRKDPIALEVISCYIDRLLDLDEVQVPFRYLASEQPYSRILETRFGPFQLYGTVDRVDEKEGVTRLIDYKTGAAELTFKDLEQVFTTPERPYALQTLLYCWLYTDSNRDAASVAPHIFPIRNMTDESFETLVHPAKEDDFSFGKVDADVENGLRTLVEKVLSSCQTNTWGTAVDARSCDNCAFASICSKQ